MNTHIILLLASIFWLPSTFAMMPYQQPTGVFGALAARHDLENRKDARQGQSEGIANIEKEVHRFTLWLGEEKILDLYKDTCAQYNANLAIESNYVKYIQTASTSSLVRAPAGYRLAEYRPIFPKLSDIMDKYEKIQSILATHKELGASTLMYKLTSCKRIVELVDLITDYEGKYIVPRDPRDIPAGPDIKARLEKQKALVDNAQAKISTIRDGLSLYLSVMGIAQDGLADDLHDLRDMAKDVEDILDSEEVTGKKLDGGRSFGEQIANLISDRYATGPDPKLNPFLMPIAGPSDRFIGVPLSDLKQEIIVYRSSLLTAAEKIRKKAVPKESILDKTTPTKPNEYFNEGMIPPAMDRLENGTMVHRAMAPGYLGYWLQRIVDRLHEITLLGTDIIDGRLQLLNIQKKLNDGCLTTCTTLFNTLTNEAIIKDCTATNINIAHITAALQENEEGIADVQKATGQTCQSILGSATKTLTTLQKDVPLLFSVRIDKTPDARPVIELYKLRRTLLILSLLNALANKKPFSPSTYTSDVFGAVPASLFPAIEGLSEAPAGKAPISDDTHVGESDAEAV
ncbi:MAG: hypothetical protein QG604_303 [Candidatus Dependentiae bacterium]|nr:hypothetical protein [Candidatus Dependentiae bacterium]